MAHYALLKLFIILDFYTNPFFFSLGQKHISSV